MASRRILSWLPDYDISECGEVRRITPSQTRKGHPYQIKGGDNGRGYRRVKLMLPCGAKKSFLVSHLVCEAWHGPRPTQAHHCAHWDGNKANDTAENLRWATPKQNVGDDRIRHGRTPRGKKNGRAVLTEQQVLDARQKYREKADSISNLARKYGVARSTMSSALKGGNWSWL